MEFAQQVRLASTKPLASGKSDVRSHDLSIIAGYAAFALVLMVALFLAGGEPGTSAADLANMTVFP
jgi:predicted cobalt transporter CbtA